MVQVKVNFDIILIRFSAPEQVVVHAQVLRVPGFSNEW